MIVYIGRTFDEIIESLPDGYRLNKCRMTGQLKDGTRFKLVAIQMETPCIRVCRLEDGKCVGCGRTQEEIRMWSTYTDEQRKEIIWKLKHPTGKI